MKIYEQQTLQFTEDNATLLQEVFLASPTVLLGKEKEPPMSATYGPKCLEQYAKFNRPGLLQKMFPALLIGMTGWYSSRCRLIWKLKGTKLSRLYFQLRVLTPRTKETGYGLLHTPRAVMIQEPTENFIHRMGDRTDKCYPHLEAQVQDYVMKGLLPTPIVMDTGHSDLEKIDQRREKIKAMKINGNGFGMSLLEMAQRKLLPTPTTSTGGVEPEGKTGRKLITVISDGKTSQLSHRFVMEMMGFPPDWTELPFLNGEMKALKPEEMQ